MLNRRSKRRYLSILHDGQAGDVVSAIANRCSELFGSIAMEEAAIRLAKSEDDVTIIKCRLDKLDSVLVAIALVDPAVVTMDMSGSVKQLRHRH